MSLAVDAKRLPEAVPRLDAAAAFPVSVMIKDALDPLAADVPFGAVGEDRSILDRDGDLVAVAIGNPALPLLPRELAAVHALVERVEVVVARAVPAQLGDELVRRPGRLVGRDGFDDAHRSTSNPS